MIFIYNHEGWLNNRKFLLLRAGLLMIDEIYGVFNGQKCVLMLKKPLNMPVSLWCSKIQCVLSKKNSHCKSNNIGFFQYIENYTLKT